MTRLAQGGRGRIGDLHAHDIAEHGVNGCCQSGSKRSASFCRRRASSASPDAQLADRRRIVAGREFIGNWPSRPPSVLRTARSGSCGIDGPTRRRSPSTRTCSASGGRGPGQRDARPSSARKRARVSASSASARFSAASSARPAGTFQLKGEDPVMPRILWRGWRTGSARAPSCGRKKPGEQDRRCH
jgi:hypothetical protein